MKRGQAVYVVIKWFHAKITSREGAEQLINATCCMCLFNKISADTLFCLPSRCKKPLYLQLGCPRNSVDTEFRRFFLQCKYIRNSAKFRQILLQKIPRNSAEFRMFIKKFRIPSEVKYALPWIPYLQREFQNRSSLIPVFSCRTFSVEEVHRIPVKLDRCWLSWFFFTVWGQDSIYWKISWKEIER